MRNCCARLWTSQRSACRSIAHSMTLQLHVAAYPSSLKMITYWQVQCGEPQLLPFHWLWGKKILQTRGGKNETTLFICECVQSILTTWAGARKHLPHILARCWEGEEKPHKSHAIKVIIFMGECLQSVYVIFCRRTNSLCFYVLNVINAWVY